MITIRNSVFETNSSSSHSICVKTGKPHTDAEAITEDIKKRLDSDNKWNLSKERTEYGRAPFTVLTTFTEKVLYYVANQCCWDTTKEEFDEYMEPVANIIKKYYPQFAGFIVETDCDDYGIGYVDEYIDLTNYLEDFLTNDDKFVVCDGDEYNIYSDMFNFGIIDAVEV